MTVSTFDFDLETAFVDFRDADRRLSVAIASWSAARAAGETTRKEARRQAFKGNDPARVARTYDRAAEQCKIAIELAATYEEAVRRAVELKAIAGARVPAEFQPAHIVDFLDAPMTFEQMVDVDDFYRSCLNDAIAGQRDAHEDFEYCAFEASRYREHAVLRAAN